MILSMALKRCMHVGDCGDLHNAGAKTGRSPRDKRIVREPGSQDNIWWAAPDGKPSNGSPNYEMDEK